MRILAIETSASACSLAIRSGDVIHARHVVAPMQQAANVLYLISELLQAAEVCLSTLDAVAFGHGPGSFTGIRIAASVAKALAFAQQIPVLPVCSLKILATQSMHRFPTHRKRLVAIDARMHEIYWASFQLEEGDQITEITAPALCHPEALQIPISGEWSGFGNAWQVYGEKMGFSPPCVSDDSNPRAEALLLLAEQIFLAGGGVSALDASPVYLRNNVTFGKSALDSPLSRG